MKALTLKIHPVTLGLIVLIALPTIAIAAGTILIPPVTVSGSQSGALLTATNHGSGGSSIAILGNSPSGRGVVGETSFNSTSKSNRESGVVGEDQSVSGSFNAGVRGTSNAGSGVLGTSAKGNGVLGQTSFDSSHCPNFTCVASGVLGQDTSVATGEVNIGVQGSSNRYAGVYGTALDVDGLGNGAGVIGVSPNNAVGVFGSSPQGAGVQAVSEYATGLTAESQYGAAAFIYSVHSTGLEVISQATPGAHTSDGLAMYINGQGGGPLLMGIGSCPGHGNQSFVALLDNVGNLTICGTLTENQFPLSVTVTRSGKHVDSYVPRQTAATVEDFGRTQLSNGFAQVEIAPDFLSIIEPSTHYLVFLTPEGDSRGLYVTDKRTNGFAIRESQSGASSVGVEYRIVAIPLDSDHRRLPLAKAISNVPPMHFREPRFPLLLRP